jgi:DNA polymerase-3 subunit alpha
MEIRGHTGDNVREERITEELDVIKSKDFSTYFLIEADVVNWCKENDIVVGPGRGSGAGSLVNYYLGITGIDPIPHNLLFFRFINPERNDYPDIDTDIEDRRRSDVKDYMRRKFKHVASIATFGTFAGKNSVRDAARVFMIPLADVNKALKGADFPPNMDFFEMWDKTDNAREFSRKYPDVIKLAKFLHGRIRSQGMHAGGIVVANQPISNYAPMQTAKDNGDEAGNRIPLVALTMQDIEDIGLIKFDFLGLKALSVISDAVKDIKKRHGKDIDLYKIPLDDRKVYDNLSQGYTQGVFQAEGHTFTHWLLQAGANEFNDLVIGTSIARPGPLTTVGEDYKKRQRGLQPISYAHDVMRKHTEETLGLIVYQEQVMLAMTDLAGMSMSTADRVRRIISKKKEVALMEQYKAEFVDGASEKVDRAVAEKLWSDFEAHAGYSFNKSHAVVYSMITYWTAWLKENYTLEFMNAVLKNEKDKDKRLDYLMEAKRLKVRVMLPHVNESGIDFEIQSGDHGDFIRFGLSDVKYISGKVGNKLLEKRPFTDYNHLYESVMEKGSGLSSRTLQALNAIGGAAFPDHPRTGNERENFFEYLAIPAFQSADLPPRIKDQFTKLEDFSDTETFVMAAMVRAIKNGDGWVRLDLVDETGSAGVFISEQHAVEAGKMYVFLVANNSVMRYITVEDLSQGKGTDFRDFLKAASFPDVPDGMMRVVAFATRKTKKGQRMATVVFSDEEKNLTSALVWPSLWAKAHTMCKVGEVVDVQLDETDDGAIFVKNIL